MAKGARQNLRHSQGKTSEVNLMTGWRNPKDPQDVPKAVRLRSGPEASRQKQIPFCEKLTHCLPKQRR